MVRTHQPHLLAALWAIALLSLIPCDSGVCEDGTVCGSGACRPDLRAVTRVRAVILRRGLAHLLNTLILDAVPYLTYLGSFVSTLTRGSESAEFQTAGSRGQRA